MARTFHRVKKSVGNAVLAKHKNKCSVCDSKKDLCVHHIIKMKPGHKDYNDIKNLTVLCRSCHMRHHRLAGDILNGKRMGNPYGRRGKIPPIKCSFGDCKRWQHGRALCKKHYEYSRRHGLF